MNGEKRGLLTVLALMALIAFAVFGCNRTKEAPNHLVGTWKTDAPRYKDRYLKFTPKSITFGTGGGTSLTYEIKYLEYFEGEGQSTVYDIAYEDIYGDDFEMRIVHNPKGGEHIVVGHIDAIWYRSSDKE